MNTILHRLSLELLVEFNINDIHDIFISNRTILLKYTMPNTIAAMMNTYFSSNYLIFHNFDVHHPLLYHLLFKIGHNY